MNASSEDYPASIQPVRDHLQAVYAPLFAAYLAAVGNGDDQAALNLAEQLEDAADEAETLWTQTLFDESLNSLPIGPWMNEAAGAMAMLSDQWTAVASAHRSRISGQD